MSLVGTAALLSPMALPFSPSQPPQPAGPTPPPPFISHEQLALAQNDLLILRHLRETILAGLHPHYPPPSGAPPTTTSFAPQPGQHLSGVELAGVADAAGVNGVQKATKTSARAAKRAKKRAQGAGGAPGGKVFEDAVVDRVSALDYGGGDVVTRVGTSAVEEGQTKSRAVAADLADDRNSSPAPTITPSATASSVGSSVTPLARKETRGERKDREAREVMERRAAAKAAKLLDDAKAALAAASASAPQTVERPASTADTSSLPVDSRRRKVNRPPPPPAPAPVASTSATAAPFPASLPLSSPSTSTSSPATSARPLPAPYVSPPGSRRPTPAAEELEKGELRPSFPAVGPRPVGKSKGLGKAEKRRGPPPPAGKMEGDFEYASLPPTRAMVASLAGPAPIQQVPPGYDYGYGYAQHAPPPPPQGWGQPYPPQVPYPPPPPLPSMGAQYGPPPVGDPYGYERPYAGSAAGYGGYDYAQAYGGPAPPTSGMYPPPPPVQGPHHLHHGGAAGGRGMGGQR